MKVLFFAHLRKVVGRDEIQLDCDAVDTNTFWSRLTEVAPCLATYRSTVRLARNCEFTDPETRFFMNDEVALIPPVSGG